MTNKQQELLNEAYENYSKEYENDNSIGMCLLVKRLDGKSTYRKPNKEIFVDLCIYDKTFSEKWGLKIEERELSLLERREIAKTKLELKDWADVIKLAHYKETYDKYNIPTKLITVTYNSKTIESYE